MNVGGRKKLPMASLTGLCSALGFEQVRTYIQSGNIVFKSSTEENSLLEDQLKEAIWKEFGFEVPVIIKTTEQLTNIINQNPFNDKTDLEENKIYFVLLNQAPNEELVQILKKESYANEAFEVTEHCIYLKCTKGYGNAKLNNNVIERKLKVEATTRNLRTLHSLLAISQEET